MKISTMVLSASAVLAVAGILAACNSGSSPSTFAPSGSMQAGLKQSQSSAGSQAGVTHYYLVLLPTLGGNRNGANAINGRSQITGLSLLKGNKVLHAELWRTYHATDLGTLGGPNSAVQSHNHGTLGQLVGWSEVSRTDPYAENFCGFGTSHICLGFSWRYGKMTSLATLGGNNSVANDVNNHGQIAGVAETSTKDPSCAPPQVFDFDAVIWQPNGKIVTLSPMSGDAVSYALAIYRDHVVGWSGPCGPTGAPVHAVLWHDGNTFYLGSLGGSLINVALDINGRGQIVGESDLPDDTATHAFLWQGGTMSDLGTLPGDVNSYAFGINDKRQVVGESCSTSSCRGFIWQNGSMTDLNQLIPTNRNLYVVLGSDINDGGQITGAAVNRKGLERAVVLLPDKGGALPSGVSAPQFTIPERLRLQLRNAGVAPVLKRQL